MSNSDIFARQVYCITFVKLVLLLKLIYFCEGVDAKM